LIEVEGASSLTQQILPPVSRLCEPIDGTSRQILAERLGLDASRYNHANQAISGIDEDITLDFTPTSSLPDAELFKDVEKLHLYCFACGQENAFPGALHVVRDSVTGTPPVASGMHCPNPDCIHPQFWGGKNLMDVTSRLLCSIDIYSRGLMCRYYEGLIRCDEAGCGLETRQLSVAGGLCLRRGCNGRMYSVDTERDVHTHLKYLESIFCVEHACKQLEKQKTFGTEKDIKWSVSQYPESGISGGAVRRSCPLSALQSSRRVWWCNDHRSMGCSLKIQDCFGRSRVRL
jgi:DNA polymerase alpha subunit A